MSKTIIAFRKVREPFGWLGNMAPYPIIHGGHAYRTSEALFQALRFTNHPDVQAAIRAQASPMAAKMVAKKHRNLIDPAELYSPADLARMRLCLNAKLDQHPELSEALVQTGDARIIEDCSRRPHGSGLYWGAARVGGAQGAEVWTGENHLGRLWMAIRAERKEQTIKQE